MAQKKKDVYFSIKKCRAPGHGHEKKNKPWSAFSGFPRPGFQGRRP